MRIELHTLYITLEQGTGTIDYTYPAPKQGSGTRVSDLRIGGKAPCYVTI